VPVAPRRLAHSPDRTRVSRSRRCSAVSTNGVVVNGMRHHMIYKSSLPHRGGDGVRGGQMRTWCLQFALTVAVVCFQPGLVFAQGAIGGVVRDASGASSQV
jgi:hypothetical protein